MIDLMTPFSRVGSSVCWRRGCRQDGRYELIRNIAMSTAAIRSLLAWGSAAAKATTLSRYARIRVFDKVALVFGQMNEPPGNRVRVALTGLTIAEHFRDEGIDVLLFIDNIYRYILAGMEVSALAGSHAFGGWVPAHAGLEMGRCRSASPRPRAARLPPFRRSMCLPTI